MTAAAAAVLVLLLPFAQAKPFASLDSSDVTVSPATLQAGLIGASWIPEAGQARPLTAAEPLRLPGFALSAAHAQVTIHHVERYLTHDVAVGEPTQWSLSNVTASGAIGDAEDARLVALPVSGTTITLGPATVRLAAADGEDRRFPARVSGAPDSGFATAGGLTLHVLAGPPGRDPLVELRGTLRLVVDGLDLTLLSDQGPKAVHTRTDADGAKAQALGTSYAAHSAVHEAVLELEDAVLVLPASDLFVGSSLVETSSAAGSWRFREATGEVEDARATRTVTGEVLLEGELVGQVHRKGPGVTVALSGSPGLLVVDGQPTTIETRAPPSAGSAFLLVLGLVGLLVAIHVGLGRWRFDRLDHAMDRKEYGRALGLARGFLGHPILAQDARLAAAICLLALGRAAEARARLAGRTDWAPRRRPTRDFLLARAEAALGRGEEATRRLANSLVAEPSLLPQAQADPLLAAVLRAARPPPAQEAYA